MKGLSGFYRAAAALLLASGFAFAAGPASAQSIYTLLHSFCKDETTCSDGQFPTGTLTADGSHNIFGTTRGGGEHGGGVVFELVYNPSTAAYRYKRIYNFCTIVVGCTDGSQPDGDRLILDANGTIYGTTSAGGPSGSGVVFELVPNDTHSRYFYYVIYQFCVQFSGCEDGARPTGALTFAGEATGGTYDGKAPLYGTTVEGGNKGKGAAYSLVPPTTVGNGSFGTLKRLYNFCSAGGISHCTDGASPSGNLVVDKNGNIWGTVMSGGANSNAGAIYKLTPTQTGFWAETAPYSFCFVSGCVDGMTPMNGVVADSSGDLYGTTATGGLAYKKCATTGCGVIFKITTSNKESTVYSFCSQTDCTDGGAAQGVTVDASGNFYGVATVGGPKNHGLFFKLQNAAMTDLFDLKCKNICGMGENPSGALIINANLDLFGVFTDAGRHGDAGTLFKLSQP